MLCWLRMQVFADFSKKHHYLCFLVLTISDFYNLTLLSEHVSAGDDAKANVWGESYKYTFSLFFSFL